MRRSNEEGKGQPTLRFEELIDEYHDEILRYLWRMQSSNRSISGAATPQDLTQQTFERAYRAYPKLRSKNHLRAWLYRIATNCALDEFRRSGRVEEVDLDQLPRSTGPDAERALEGSLARIEDRTLLRAAIDRLPPRQKAAVVLRYLNELSYAECALVMETEPSTVRANVYQALRRLGGELTLKEGLRDEPAV